MCVTGYVYVLILHTGIYKKIFANSDHSGIFKKVTRDDEEPLYVFKDMGGEAETPGWYVTNMWVQSIRHTKKKKDRLRIKNNFDN